MFSPPQCVVVIQKTDLAKKYQVNRQGGKFKFWMVLFTEVSLEYHYTTSSDYDMTTLYTMYKHSCAIFLQE